MVQDATPKYGNFTHVIFDMDGLLLNTESIYTEVFSRVARKYGKVYTWEIKQKLMGRPAMIGAQMAIDLMGLPTTVETFLSEIEEHKSELFPSAIFLPGAENLIRHFVKHNVPIALASGSRTKDYHSKTTNHKELFSLFPIIILGDNPEIKHGKPEPDQFLITASKFPNKPSNGKVLVFEDSSNGVLAAKAAGMGVVMVPDERVEKELYHNPTLVLKSLEEFVPEEFGFPPF